MGDFMNGPPADVSKFVSLKVDNLTFDTRV